MEYIRSEVNSIGALNAELEKIETALDDKLGTKGTGPRVMSADLDMNSNQILNLGTPVSPTDPVRLQDIPDLVTAAQGANYVGETAPLTAFQGMRWYNPSLPATFVYYIDGDSGQWVEEAHEGIDGGLRADLGVNPSDVGAVVNAIETPEKAGDAFVPAVTYKKKATDSGGTVVVWPTLNKVASDLFSCVISGGGQPNDENLIGYTESVNEVVGDASTTVFTSSFNIESTSEVRVELIRADGVRLGVTFVSGILIERVGGKARITYPIAGHFVNDATGGAEGTNPALLTTQKLIIRSTVKTENLGSNCQLSGIHGSYDQVITEGIMHHSLSAHSRILGGTHNFAWGGSYITIRGGDYVFGLGGTNIDIDATGYSGAIAAGGAGVKHRGGANYSLGGSGIDINGIASTSLGGQNIKIVGNGSTGTGREITITGNDAFGCGFQTNLTGAYSFGSGFGNTVAIYGGAVGRGNTVAEGGFASGRQNSTQAIYGSAKGYRGIAYNAGESVTGYGLVGDAANGVKQNRKLALAVDTTDASLIYPVDLAGVSSITIPNDSCAMVRVKAVALRDNNTEARTFAGDFVVNRVGSADPTVDGSASDVSVPASKTLSTSGSLLFLRGISGGLRARVQGEAGKNVRWLVEIELLQVIN